MTFQAHLRDEKLPTWHKVKQTDKQTDRNRVSLKQFTAEPTHFPIFLGLDFCYMFEHRQGFNIAFQEAVAGFQLSM